MLSSLLAHFAVAAVSFVLQFVAEKPKPLSLALGGDLLKILGAFGLMGNTYRGEKKSLQILLSRTQAEPGRKVKQEQEEISRNHVPRLFLGSVVWF